MRQLSLRTAEILLVRGLPGVISLLSILWVGRLLGVTAYGEFSTVIASAGFVGTLLFGGISQTIVPRHARYEQLGLARQFERGLLAAGLIVACILVALAASIFATNVLLATGILICACGGLNQIFQQKFQAKEAFWRYGLVSLAQASVFAGIIMQTAGRSLGSVDILVPYLISQLVALLVAFGLAGCLVPALPSREMCQDFRSLGLGYTAGNLAENCLYTGFRWLLVAFGSPTALAAFSFAIDLVQRSVSVVINLVGFALIPKAFREAGNADELRFRIMLMKGGIFGLALAMCLAFAIIFVASTGWVQALAVPHFVPWIFLVIATAAGINRFKKVAIDPIAIQRGRIWAIVLGYSVGAILAAAAAFLALNRDLDELVAPIYLGGYVIAVLTTFMATFLSLKSQRTIVAA